METNLGIKNKVADSGLMVFDLSELYPNSVVEFDISPLLFKELILKEKDFRASMRDMDKTKFSDKNVAVFCSSDAIVPVWAYMLVVKEFSEIASKVYFGNKEKVENIILLEAIENLDLEFFRDKKTIIKGCGDERIGENAYMLISQKILPAVQSLMYGEPCSTVPIYKKKRNA